MKRDQLKNPSQNCPYAHRLAVLLQNQDASAMLSKHVPNCPACQAVMQNMSQAVDEAYDTSFSSLMKGFLKNVLIGSAFNIGLNLLGQFNNLAKLYEKIKNPESVKPVDNSAADMVRTLHNIEQRLDVAQNPNNLTGKRIGPFTR